MASSFYRTRKGIKVFLSKNYHYHDSITHDMLQKILIDKNDYIEECHSKREDCVIEYDFDYPIGVTHCVSTTDSLKDKIYYKMRGIRKYLSRMIHGIFPQECNYVTMILRLDRYNNYILLTSWIGQLAKPELGNISFFDSQPDPYAAVCECANFWLNHALIDDEPTAEELLKDIKILYKENYQNNSLNAEILSAILNKRLDKNDISVPSDLELSDDNILHWINTNILLNKNEEFSSRKNYIEG